ncbi:hypothetical protein ABE10_01605, partial [Bacillus toyonensis]|nr:hypothetical protein [Bacillus toyonensis]
MLGRRAGVAGGRSEDVEHAAPTLECILQRLPEELHRYVLEGQSRPLGEPDEGDPAIDRPERDRRGEGGRGVGALTQTGEIVAGDVGGEQAEDLGGEGRIVEVSPGLQRRRVDLRELGGDGEAAVRR